MVDKYSQDYLKRTEQSVARVKRLKKAQKNWDWSDQKSQFHNLLRKYFRESKKVPIEEVKAERTMAIAVPAYTTEIVRTPFGKSIQRGVSKSHDVVYVPDISKNKNTYKITCPILLDTVIHEITGEGLWNTSPSDTDLVMDYWGDKKKRLKKLDNLLISNAYTCSSVVQRIIKKGDLVLPFYFKD